MSLFQQAHKLTKKLRFALAGPSGCGKSWTSLVIARALGERIAVIDTERGGASYYADRFDFDTLELDSFHPERYIAALDAAREEGYEVVIVDSLSHAWFGKDGTLDLVDRAAKKSQSNNTYFAWRDVTPLQNRLVDALIQAPLHVIVTLRTKTAYTIETDSRGKQVPKKIGLAPIQRDSLEYEFDVCAEMTLDHTLTVTKSRVFELADLTVERPGQAFAAQVRTALTGRSMELVNRTTGEIYPETRRAAQERVVRAIGQKVQTIIKPLKHTGLYHAVIFHSFGLDKPIELPSLPLGTLEDGLAVFDHLCTALKAGRWQRTDQPDAWIAQELRTHIAQEHRTLDALARGDAPREGDAPTMEEADAPHHAYGPDSPDLMAAEEAGDREHVLSGDTA